MKLAFADAETRLGAAIRYWNAGKVDEAFFWGRRAAEKSPLAKVVVAQWLKLRTTDAAHCREAVELLPREFGPPWKSSSSSTAQIPPNSQLVTDSLFPLRQGSSCHLLLERHQVMLQRLSRTGFVNTTVRPRNHEGCIARKSIPEVTGLKVPL